MSTELLELDPITQELEKQNVTESVINGLKEKYLSLTIDGIDDKKGYEAVRAGRIECKNTRVLAKKICEKGREKAIEEQKAWIAKEKEVTGKIAEVEKYLEEQESAIDAEKQRIKDEAARAEQVRIQSRINRLQVFGYAIDYDSVKSMSAEDFEKTVTEVKAEYEKALAEKAEAERLQREEAERMRKEREELETLRRQQQEELAKIESEKKAIEDARLAHENKIRREAEEKQRAIDLEKATKAAAEKAKADLLQKQKEDAERKAEADRKATAKAERIERLKPVKQKLVDFANLVGNIEVPTLNDVEADAILHEAKTLLAKVQAHIITKSENL